MVKYHVRLPPLYYLLIDFNNKDIVMTVDNKARRRATRAKKIATDAQVLGTGTITPDAYLTGVDIAPTLNNIFADTSGPVVVRAEARPYRSNGLGGSWACNRLGSSVYVPARKHLYGSGDPTSFRPLSTGTDSDLFRFNVSSDGNTPSVNLPLGFSSSVSGIVAVNRDETGAITTNVQNICKYAGQHEFYNIFSLSFQTIVRQTTGGNSYSDLTRIVRLRSQSQPDTNVGGTRAALAHLPTNGDGFVISQISNDGPIYSGGSQFPRGYTVFLTARTGGRISEIINGDVRLNACSSFEAANFHMEYGFVQGYSSSGHYRTMMFYMRGDQTVNGVDDPVVGVPFQLTKSNDVNLNNYFSSVSHISFIYAAGWTHPYTTTKGNFLIEYAQSVNFDQLYRVYYTTDGQINNIFGSTQAQSDSQIANSDTCYLDFNNYSHFASKRASWSVGPTNGSYIGGRWDFSINCGKLNVSVGIVSALSGTIVMPVPSGSTNPILQAQSQVQWTQPTGTYYYKVAMLYDKIRMIGYVGTYEFSQTLTNGSNTLPKLGLDTGIRGTPTMVRVYRGASTGSYNAYVDIPVIAATALIDNGTDVCGFSWIARTAGAADTFNTGGDNLHSFSIKSANYESGSDAYGNVELVMIQNAQISVGGWRRGDKVMLRDPVGENGLVKLGWLRMTNCTSAAPAHTLYTDWMPIMQQTPHGSRTTTQLQTASGTVNTQWKSTGLRVFNSTTLKWVTAQGSTATSTWIEDGTGTVYTPV